MRYKNKTIRESHINKYGSMNIKPEGSNYQQSFEDNKHKRSKSKALNEKINFKLEELSTSCKFPPIPKGKLKDSFINKNPIGLALNDRQYATRLETKLRQEQLNKTVDTNIRYHKSKPKARLKNRYDKRSLSSHLDSLNLEFLKTNVDRPKIMPLQSTLDGVLESNLAIKTNQKVLQKYKYWAGMKIPINSNNSPFNRCRDKMNHWDEKRDGVFHQI